MTNLILNGYRSISLMGLVINAVVFSVLLENIRNGDVSVFLKHLERKRRREYDQKFEQHQKGMHDKNQQEQMERHQKRQMIPRKMFYFK